MKHTPAPWTIANNGKPLFGDYSIRQDPRDWDGKGYQHIAILPASRKGTHCGEMFYANACLISAAPDLLEACKAVLHDCEDLDMVESNQPGRQTTVFELLTTAIAKAEGR
jgi:hypothetical protein